MVFCVTHNNIVTNKYCTLLYMKAFTAMWLNWRTNFSTLHLINDIFYFCWKSSSSSLIFKRILYENQSLFQSWIKLVLHFFQNTLTNLENDSDVIPPYNKINNLVSPNRKTDKNQGIEYLPSRNQISDLIEATYPMSVTTSHADNYYYRRMWC